MIRHLLGRGGIFILKWELVLLLENAAREYIAVTEVIQDRDNNHFHLFVYTYCFVHLVLEQTDTYLKVLMYAHRVIARSLTQWLRTDGCVHCNMLGSLYTD